jgi:hypothetical protein
MIASIRFLSAGDQPATVAEGKAMKTCAQCHRKNPPQGLQQMLDLLVLRADLMSKRILEALET